MARSPNLNETVRQYPRDRVALNQVGRILFLERRYADAVAALEKTLDVDPEDLQAHYNLMLCYRGLGQPEKADREEKLFLRFKADESSQALTAKPRLLSPEDNNERQPIHDHISGTAPASKAPLRARGHRPRVSCSSAGGAHAAPVGGGQ